MRRYDAIILDADGTLLNSRSEIRPRTRETLRRAMESGVKVMLATGRSAGTARPIALELGSPLPAIVFNGAGLYCPRRDELIQSLTLAADFIEGFVSHANRLGLFWFANTRTGTSMSPPVTSEHRELTRRLTGVAIHRAGAPLPDAVVRINALSDRHAELAELKQNFEAIEDLERANFRYFELSTIPAWEKSELLVAEFEPPNGGKGEALAFLEREHGIPADRVVAIGDADNDLPMLERAGLSVAMANATPRVKQTAHREIGDHNSHAIADLIEELFF